MMLGTETPKKKAEMFLHQKNPGGFSTWTGEVRNPRCIGSTKNCLVDPKVASQGDIFDPPIHRWHPGQSFRKRCWQRGNWRSLSVGWERPPLFHINGLPILIQTLTWSNSRRGETQNNKRRNETWIKSCWRLESLDVRCTLYAENDDWISTNFSSRTSVSGSGSIFV